MSSQLRLFDPQIKEKPDQESFIEPSWLVRLRYVDGQIKVQNVLFNIKYYLLRIVSIHFFQIVLFILLVTEM